MDDETIEKIKMIIDSMKIRSDIFEEVSNDFKYMANELKNVYDKSKDPFNFILHGNDIINEYVETNNKLEIKMMMIQHKMNALSEYENNFVKGIGTNNE